MRLFAGGRFLAGLIVTGMLVPAGAAAAPAKPGVTTGAAANVAPSTATVAGGVTPNERATTFFFQYGTTRLYGAQTPTGAVGNGNKRVNVTADLAGLAPATRYHYRLVAQNARGITTGKDRTFKTKRQPLGLALGAAPNPVDVGGTVVLNGNLSGTGNADREVVLQSNPFPYTQGFQNASNIQKTDTLGNFSFPVLNLLSNTQFKVAMPNNPDVQSPIVAVGAAPKVTMKVKRVSRRGPGAVYRFSGRVTPKFDGVLIAIQRKKSGTYRTIDGTVARGSSSAYSTFSTRVRLRKKSSRYRIYAGIANGQYAPNTSRSKRIKVRG